MQGGGLKKPKDSEVIRDLKLLCRDNLVRLHTGFSFMIRISRSRSSMEATMYDSLTSKWNQPSYVSTHDFYHRQYITSLLLALFPPHCTDYRFLQAVAHDAFRALVNLSDSPLLVTSLAEPTFLNFLVSYIIVRRISLRSLAKWMLELGLHHGRTRKPPSPISPPCYCQI